MTSPDFFLETEGVFPDYISEIHNIFPDQLVLQMMRVTDPSFKTKKLGIFFQFGQKVGSLLNWSKNITKCAMCTVGYCVRKNSSTWMIKIPDFFLTFFKFQ